MSEADEPLGDSENLGGGESPEDGTPTDPLARWIAVTLAAIAFLGSGLAILQTQASNNESNTARETTRTAVEALRANVVESSGQRLEQGIVAESDALVREQAFVARQAGELGASADPLTREELTASVGSGTELPRARTAEELRQLELEAERLSLRQDALAETRVTWNDRSTQYTTAIAMLAVALFLVGFSLVLRGIRRRAFYALGVVFALATLAWAGHVRSLPIPETPESAIGATARGAVDGANGRQRKAVEEYSAAIEIDDDFVPPYTGRAIARLLEANPDFLATGALTGDQAVLPDAIADLRRALDLGGDRDFLTLTLASVVSFAAGEYDTSVEAADKAIAINDLVPDIWMLRSAAEVGRGDAEAARSSLGRAARLISGADPSGRTRRLVAEYVTYLEQVLHAVPAQAGLAQQLERQSIRLETQFNLDREVTGTAPARGTASVDRLRYEDGKLRLRLRWSDLPKGTALTAIGFERPTPDGAWVQPSELALFRTVGGTGEEVGSVELERACVPTEVRVDLYLDGALTDSVTGPGAPPTC